MDEENHFEIYNLAIHPFRGILLTVDEVSPERTRLLWFQIHISIQIHEYGLKTDKLLETFLRNHRSNIPFS